MSVHQLRPPLADGLLEQRLRYLMDVLAEAQGELAGALLAGNVLVMVAAARRVASVGWLMREASDKYERETSCGCGEAARS